MLYCKVKGISEKRERVKRRYKLRQDDFATEQVVVYQNCANCILKVCPSHTVCGNTQKKKKILRADLSFISLVQVVLVLYCIEYQAKFVHISERGNAVLNVVVAYLLFLNLVLSIMIPSFLFSLPCVSLVLRV